MLSANVMPRPPNVLPAILTTRNIKVTRSRNAKKDVFLNIGWTDEIKSTLNPCLVYIYCKITIPQQIKARKYGANHLCNICLQNINLACCLYNSLNGLIECVSPYKYQRLRLYLSLRIPAKNNTNNIYKKNWLCWQLIIWLKTTTRIPV